MSSFKKHFQHFSLQKPPQVPNSPLGPTIPGHHSRPVPESQIMGGDTKSTVPQQVSTTSNSASNASSLTTNNNCHRQQSSNMSMDALSFKSDIFNCLDMCTAYIQALNTLCSTGAVLAQNLTQVFSRDVNVDGDQLVSGSTKSGHLHAAKIGSHRRGIFGLKSSRNDPCPASSMASQDDELDSNYYEVAEQFLQVWENMSVSTAGASATIKTDTLMTLQDIINKLESQKNTDPKSKGDNVPDSNNSNLEKSIRAAKSNLLAYIELQSQFSYNSWKSLNHLSKVLRSDPSMRDAVSNVRRHFKNKNQGDNGQDGHGDNDRELKKMKGQKIESVHNAIQLLSLEESSADERSRKRSGHRRSTSRKHKSSSKRRSKRTPTNEDARIMAAKIGHEAKVGLHNLDSSSFMDNVNMKQSTWPMKDCFNPQSKSKSSEMPDLSSWFASSNSANDFFKASASDPFPWNAFSNSSSSSASTLNDGHRHLLSDPLSSRMTLPASSGLSLNSVYSQPEQHQTSKFAHNGILRPAFDGSLGLLDDQTNLSVIELAKKISLSSEAIKQQNQNGFGGYEATFSYPEDNGYNVGAMDATRTAKTSTWPLKQETLTNNNFDTSSNNDWPAAFNNSPYVTSSDNSNSLFNNSNLGSLSKYNQGSSSTMWPFDQLTNGQKQLQLSKSSNYENSSPFFPQESNNNSAAAALKQHNF